MFAEIIILLFAALSVHVPTQKISSILIAAEAAGNRTI